MGIEVKKQNRESSQALIRRFTKKIQQSGILRRVRKSRFYASRENKEMKKRRALRREKLKIEYEKLKKMGLEKK